MKSKPILPPLLKCLIKFLLHKKVVSHSLASFLTMAKKFVLLYLKKQTKDPPPCLSITAASSTNFSWKNILAWFKILGTLLMPTKLFGNIVSPPWLLQWSILRYKSCKEFWKLNITLLSKIVNSLYDFKSSKLKVQSAYSIYVLIFAHFWFKIDHCAVD